MCKLTKGVKERLYGIEGRMEKIDDLIAPHKDMKEKVLRVEKQARTQFTHVYDQLYSIMHQVDRVRCDVHYLDNGI